MDYNASAPLSSSVEEWLREGDLPWGNPSSMHGEGKKSRRLINQTQRFLQDLLHATGKVIFHSGATEGINTFFKTLAWSSLGKQEKLHFFYSPLDHSAVLQTMAQVQEWGFPTTALPVTTDGGILPEEWISIIQQERGSAQAVLNFTWMHNDLGHYYPLAGAQEIKKATGCFIHVDASQVPGKVPDFAQSLQTHGQDIECITFSGHKFGACKGIGFSLCRPDYPWMPLLHGGGQQGGMRSGTENPVGVYSLLLALEDLQRQTNYSATLQAKEWLQQQLSACLHLQGGRGHIVGATYPWQSSNTLFIALTQTHHKSENLLAALDHGGFALSSGPACGAGGSLFSQTLKVLGYRPTEVSASLRLSFSPLWQQPEVQSMWSSLEPLLQQLLR